MKNDNEKKGLLNRLNENKKAKKSSCCCNIEVEEIPEENVEEKTIQNAHVGVQTLAVNKIIITNKKLRFN